MVFMWMKVTNIYSKEAHHYVLYSISLSHFRDVNSIISRTHGIFLINLIGYMLPTLRVFSFTTMKAELIGLSPRK